MLITPLTRKAHADVKRCATELHACTQQAHSVAENISDSTVAKLFKPRYIMLVFASGLLVTQILWRKPAKSQSAKSTSSSLVSSTQIFSFILSVWVLLSKTRAAETAVSQEQPATPTEDTPYT